MIKRIELVNFMSHEHTVIEPADGLTVLVGPNNCGKSAVVTALQILCYNDTSTYVTRHGEKECRIKVETVDGDVIEWSRKRSSTKYVINGETFDRLRGNVPDALKNVLRLPKVKLDQSPEEFDIHFGSQKEPVFLINESGRAAAGFFAASSDASRLIEMQKHHGQKVKDANREVTRLQNEATEVTDQIEALQGVPGLKERFVASQTDRQDIESARLEIKQLKKSIQHLNSDRHRIEYLKNRLALATETIEPPVMQETTRLSKLTSEIRSYSVRQSRYECIAVALSAIPESTVVEDTKPLAKIVSELRLLQNRTTKTTGFERVLCDLPNVPALIDTSSLRTAISSCRTAAAEFHKLQQSLEPLTRLENELFEQIESYTLSNPVCPTCATPLSKEQIVENLKEGLHGKN